MPKHSTAAEVVAAICLLAALILGGCRSFGPGAAQVSTVSPGPTKTAAPNPKITYTDGLTPSHPFSYTTINFAANISYTDALILMTDQGMQPVDMCAGAQLSATWKPLGQEGTFSTGLQQTGYGQLGVFVTPDAPTNWLAQLAARPQIRSLLNGNESCQLIPPGDPSSPTGVFLGPDAPTVVVNAQFAPTESYDQALATITNLGFRLIDWCAEHTPTGSGWQTAGQERSFAATHSLLIATTFANSTTWQTQLQHTAGVTDAQVNYTPTC